MANGVPSVVTYSLSRFLNGLPNASGAASVTVNLSSYGTATPGVDFTFPQAVTIPAGASSVDFDVTILPDNEAEYWYESFQIAARPGPNSTVLYNPSSLVNIFDGTPNLHIDSNNDGKNDWYYSSSTAFLDDSIESDPNLPGKYIDVSNTDANGDWIPDFAEGFSLASGASNPSATGVKFVPVALQLSPYSNFSTAKVTFTYDASDPASVVIPGNPATAKEWDYKPAPGSLRLWKRDGTASRNGRPVNQGGDFIQSGVSYTIAELGGFTFYVEAVSPAAAGYGQKLPISVQLSVNGIPATLSDTVNVTPVYNPAGWRAVAREEANFDLKAWNPQNGYSVNRDQLKTIYSFYEHLYKQDYASHGNGSQLGNFQWMGLARVAGVSVVGGLDLMQNVNSIWAILSPWLPGVTPAIQIPTAVMANLIPHLQETQITFMEMAFAIFNDVSWQHVAYREAGIEEIRRLGDKPDGALPGPTRVSQKLSIVDVLAGWELIDLGTTTSIWAGNRQLINNEQNVTLSPFYQIMNNQNMIDSFVISSPINPFSVTVPAMSKALALTIGSKTGGPPFPGAQTFYDYTNFPPFPTAPYPYSSIPYLVKYLTDDKMRFLYITSQWQRWSTPTLYTQQNRFTYVGTPLP